MIHSAKEFIELRTSSDLEQQQRATHECASDEVWFDVLRNFPEMTVWVVRNKTISLNVLHQLAKHSDVNVRRAVASKRKLDKTLFAILSADCDESVRERIAYNKKTPGLILRKLSEDVSERVAAIARERLDGDCE